ncbi:transmembrane 220 family protein [Xanthocytophaga flava]|uniref:transmembrane 220 family protein n=1 Tax=Xanthocytophaga flava TaxID=3048013 RepID=UPI0028D0214F|nr:transmembrane 220 family protein [Xanthocytophaga flavus]MDJ1473600.1 transmembrane 220 family protein [Xanthocytophaga flavus]
MRYIGLFFGFIFLLFTYWQFNDPDPVWWVTIYLISTYCSFLVFRARYNLELFAVLAILYISGAVNSWLQMTAWEGFVTEGEGLSMKSVNQELARESAGLAICAVAMLIFLLIGYIKRSNRT